MQLIITLHDFIELAIFGLFIIFMLVILFFGWLKDRSRKHNTKQLNKAIKSKSYF